MNDHIHKENVSHVKYLEDLKYQLQKVSELSIHKENCPNAKYIEDLKHQLQKVSELRKMYMDIHLLNESQLRKDKLKLENLKKNNAFYEKQIEVLIKQITVAKVRIKKAKMTDKTEKESQQLMIENLEELLNLTSEKPGNYDNATVSHN